MSTTSQYTVVGYGGLGGTGHALADSDSRRISAVRATTRNTKHGHASSPLLLAAAGIASLSGCSGKYPDRNSVYTAPGSYTYTVTATDGVLKHSATYSLTVTAK